MNKIKCITAFVVVLYTLLFTIPNEVNAHINPTSEFNLDIKVVKPSDALITERLQNMQSNISIKYTSEVRSRILQYTVYHRRTTEKLIGRAMLFFPLFDQEISKRNLPSELKNVAVVESLLKPHATSHSGAAGIWQFIKSTGRMYDLEISDMIDERRDPELSTAAALDYLESLYKQFDDWTLAIAAYNSGPGNIRKAIRKAGSRDFWVFRKYLPKETQAYIPRVIASMYLMNYYHEHNLEPITPTGLFQSTVEVVPVKDLNLSDLSVNLNIDIKVLKFLNPLYKKNVIPVSTNEDKQYTLILPDNRLYEYYKIYDEVSFALFANKNRNKKPSETIVRRDSLVPIERLDNEYAMTVSLQEPRRVF